MLHAMQQLYKLDNRSGIQIVVKIALLCENQNEVAESDLPFRIAPTRDP
jgi:hypothetical protein